MFTRSEGNTTPSAEDLKDVEAMFMEFRQGKDKTQLFFKIDDLLNVLCEDMTMEQRQEIEKTGGGKSVLWVGKMRDK